jgi:hypothetical protein
MEEYIIPFLNRINIVKGSLKDSQLISIDEINFYTDYINNNLQHFYSANKNKFDPVTIENIFGPVQNIIISINYLIQEILYKLEQTNFKLTSSFFAWKKLQS